MTGLVFATFKRQMNSEKIAEGRFAEISGPWKYRVSWLPQLSGIP